MSRFLLTLTSQNIKNFWAKVTKAGPDDCWLWTGGLSGDGYPAFGVGGRQFPGSHVALTLDGRPRPQPPFHHALHGDCSNPLCVNPAHLRWGSNDENVEDKTRLKRTNPRRGERSPLAKLSEADVRYIREAPRTGRELAKAFKVSPATISLIRNRRVWAHIS